MPRISAAHARSFSRACLLLVLLAGLLSTVHARVSVTDVTITLTNLVQTWDGTAKAPTVTTNPTGVAVVLTYNGGTTAPSAVGSYTVVATPVDTVSYSGAATATLQITAVSQSITFPTPTERPLNTPITLAATASSGLPVTFQLLSGPASLDGDTLTITGVGDITVLAQQAGNAYTAATETTLTFAVDPQTLPRIANLSSSSRAIGSTASDQRLIFGFVLSHATPQPVLLRAVGPGLTGFGVSGVLADPAIELFDANGDRIASNDNWDNAAAVANLAQTLGAFPLETDSRDAALVVDLAAGAYSLHVTGGTGAVIAEIYDGDTARSQVGNNLVNVSTRGFVEAGTPLIGGLVVDGNGPQSVLIRGVGPTLANHGVSGVLQNPVLTVYDANQNVVATNVRWDTPTTAGAPDAAAIAAAAQTAGAFDLPAASADASLVLELDPGVYSVHVTSADSASGVALLEIYELLLP